MLSKPCRVQLCRGIFLRLKLYNNQSLLDFNPSCLKFHMLPYRDRTWKGPHTTRWSCHSQWQCWSPSKGNYINKTEWIPLSCYGKCYITILYEWTRSSFSCMYLIDLWSHSHAYFPLMAEAEASLRWTWPHGDRMAERLLDHCTTDFDHDHWIIYSRGRISDLHDS